MNRYNTHLKMLLNTHNPLVLKAIGSNHHLYYVRLSLGESQFGRSPDQWYPLHFDSLLSTYNQLVFVGDTAQLLVSDNQPTSTPPSKHDRRAWCCLSKRKRSRQLVGHSLRIVIETPGAFATMMVSEQGDAYHTVARFTIREDAQPQRSVV